MEITKDGLITLAVAAYNRQDVLQTKILGEGWKGNPPPFYRAVWTELAEAFERLPWEWWKKKELTPAARIQTILEFIDIMHFVISSDLAIGSGKTNQRLGEDMADMLGAYNPEYFQRNFNGTFDVMGEIEEFVVESIRFRRCSMMRVCRLIGGMGVTPANALLLFFGKNALNSFRQDNGYKQGTYRKIIAGREDNEHLADIVSDLAARAVHDEHAVSDLIRMAQEDTLIAFIYDKLSVVYEENPA